MPKSPNNYFQLGRGGYWIVDLDLSYLDKPGGYICIGCRRFSPANWAVIMRMYDQFGFLKVGGKTVKQLSLNKYVFSNKRMQRAERERFKGGKYLSVSIDLTWAQIKRIDRKRTEYIAWKEAERAKEKTQ